MTKVHLTFIEQHELCRYMTHLNHATMILNPTNSSRKSAKPSAKNKLHKQMENFLAIMDDTSLDA